MPLTRKPTRATVNAERKVEEFINRPNLAETEEPDTNKKPAMIRFDPELLKKVDAAARKRGVSRSAWVQFVCSRALDAGEG